MYCVQTLKIELAWGRAPGRQRESEKNILLCNIWFMKHSLKSFSAFVWRTQPCTPVCLCVHILNDSFFSSYFFATFFFYSFFSITKCRAYGFWFSQEQRKIQFSSLQIYDARLANSLLPYCIISTKTFMKSGTKWTRIKIKWTICMQRENENIR